MPNKISRQSLYMPVIVSVKLADVDATKKQLDTLNQTKSWLICPKRPTAILNKEQVNDASSKRDSTTALYSLQFERQIMTNPTEKTIVEYRHKAVSYTHLTLPTTPYV